VRLNFVNNYKKSRCCVIVIGLTTGAKYCAKFVQNFLGLQIYDITERKKECCTTFVRYIMWS